MSLSSPTPESTERSRWLTEQVKPHETALRGYLRHQFPAMDADDIVQESYLKMMQARAAGTIASAKAYFFSVARNTALRLAQRHWKLYGSTPVNELPDWRVLDQAPDAADVTHAHERVALVAEAVDGLPPRCRQIVRLAIVDGLAADEIALRVGLAESTVRGQLARGVRKCGDYLRAKGEIK